MEQSVNTIEYLDMALDRLASAGPLIGKLTTLAGRK